MIVKMVKIMVMGPLDLLTASLDSIQELGILQVDQESILSEEVVSASAGAKDISKDEVMIHQLYTNLRKQIDDFLSHLQPQLNSSSTISSVLDVNSLITLLPVHIKDTKKRFQRIEDLQRKLIEFGKYKVVLDTVGEIDTNAIRNDLQWIAVKLNNKDAVETVRSLIEKEYAVTSALEILQSSDGEFTIGVIAAEKHDAEQIENDLEERKIEIFKKPSELDSLLLSKQKEQLERILIATEGLHSSLIKKQEEFEAKWYARYLRTLNWLDTKISVFDATAAVVKTRMCFFVYGWLPARDYPLLAETLEAEFKGKVVTEQCELIEQDFSRIPTALHNPAYFEPFELFSRLLPIPPYSSFDITPFIGIFFPIFFGMMLGDIGYGLILLAVSIVLTRKFSSKKNVLDAGKILFVCSLYTIVFGLLYGELLGTLGHDYLGMQPLGFDRQESIIPMLCFAISIGVVHVVIGLILGVIVALRRNNKKEAVVKVANIGIILCVCVLLASYYSESVPQVQKPLLITIAIVMPVVILVGGLMAPLELLKNIGNIISYARIMAIGLTSVLLAYVANFMAGRIGSIWAGILVAVLLHFFNLILGVFAPTIHSLRLHYVEFLSKFMEPGGKEFKPLARQ